MKGISLSRSGVSGPISSTNNSLSRWNGTAGDSLRDGNLVESKSAEIVTLKFLSVLNGILQWDGSNDRFQVDDHWIFLDLVEFSKTATFINEIDNGSSGTSKTIDWNSGNKQKITLTDNVTLSFVAPAGPSHLSLTLIQDTTGGRTVTWPASVRWPDNTTPTLTTTGDRIDQVTFFFDGSVYRGGILKNYSL